MSFTFKWPRFSDRFHEDAIEMLNSALNKGSKPPVIADRIEVVELEMGTQPPDLEIRDIGDLTMDQFRGIFRLTYTGDAYIVLKTMVQANSLHHKKPDLHLMGGSRGILAANQPLVVPMHLRLSNIRLNSYVVLVVSKRKGITIVFKTDPLQSVDISSTFDSIGIVQNFIRREIEGQLRRMFREDLPAIIHRLSQQWVNNAIVDVETTAKKVTPLARQLTFEQLHPGPMGRYHVPFVGPPGPFLSNRRLQLGGPSFSDPYIRSMGMLSESSRRNPSSIQALGGYARSPVNSFSLQQSSPSYNSLYSQQESQNSSVVHRKPDDLDDEVQSSSPTWNDRASSTGIAPFRRASIDSQLPYRGRYSSQAGGIDDGSTYADPDESELQFLQSPSQHGLNPRIADNIYASQTLDQFHFGHSQSHESTQMSNVSMDENEFSRFSDMDDDDQVILRPGKNTFISQLSFLNHSHHTLSPHTNALEHFTVRSAPPRPITPFGPTVPEKPPARARRKRLHHLGGKKNGRPESTDHSNPTPTLYSKPPSEFDASDIEHYFFEGTEHTF